MATHIICDHCDAVLHVKDSYVLDIKNYSNTPCLNCITTNPTVPMSSWVHLDLCVDCAAKIQSYIDQDVKPST